MTICTGQAVKVVEEGKKSHDHYRTAVHALENILSKLHLVNVEDPNIMYKY